MEQLTWADILPKELELGYIKNEDVSRYLGKEIRFDDLGNYIGRRVIMKMPRQSAIDYKCIYLLEILQDSDDVYEWTGSGAKKVGACSRVRFTDHPRLRDVHASVSEMHCSSGRYCRDNHPVTFYEIV